MRDNYAPNCPTCWRPVVDGRPHANVMRGRGAAAEEWHGSVQNGLAGATVVLSVVGYPDIRVATSKLYLVWTADALRLSDQDAELRRWQDEQARSAREARA